MLEVECDNTDNTASRDLGVMTEAHHTRHSPHVPPSRLASETRDTVIHLQLSGDLCLIYKSPLTCDKGCLCVPNIEREKYDREEDIIVKFSIL